MDPYKILGIDKDATLEEIQRAYRKQAKKHHPDMGGDSWAFQQVRAAYEQVVQLREAKPQGSGTERSTIKPSSVTRTSNRGSVHTTETPTPPRSESSRNRYSAEPLRGLWGQAPRLLVHARDRLWQVCFRQLPLQNETTLFILVNVLDIFMTYILIQFGGIEANPVARLFYERWGFDGMIFFKMGMVALITVLAQIIAQRNLRAARWILHFGTLAAGIVVVYSVLLFVRHVQSW